MSRIRLFDVPETFKHKPIHLVLEDMQSQMIAIDAAIEDGDLPNLSDEQLVTRIENSQDALEDNIELIDTALPTIGTLEDTAYAIAPAIVEARQVDLEMIRQVARVSAANLGLDESDLIPADLDTGVGKPLDLQMEGFKEKASAALKSIWRVIKRIFSEFWAIFEGIMTRAGMKAKKLKANVEKVRELDATAIPPNSKLKAAASWTRLTTEGKYENVADLIKCADNLHETTQATGGTADKFYLWVTDLPGRMKVTAASDIESKFNKAMSEFKSFIPSKMSKFGNNLDLNAPFGMNDLMYIDGADLKGEGLELYAALEKVKAVVRAKDAKGSEFDMDALSKADLLKVAASMASAITSELTIAATFNKGAKRNADSLVDKIAATLESNWGDALDKVDSAKQNELRPYLSATADVIRRGSTLFVKPFFDTLSLSVEYMDAANDFLEAHLKLAAKGEKKDDDKGPKALNK